ncbi:GNAT family N-acetyltransferase [Candidatus Woesebacteria bacterium]|nr:GNAT family N-acetyltransferase [Candidatus Woesebacteria bacterium]
MTNTSPIEPVSFKQLSEINPSVCFFAQLQLEGLGVVDANRLVKIESSHFDAERQRDDHPPNVLLTRFSDKTSIYFTHSLPQELVDTIQNEDLEDVLTTTNNITAILKAASLFHEFEQSITYTIPNLGDLTFEGTRSIVASDDPLINQFNPTFYRKFPMAYAVLHESKVVSCCVSSRENDRAGEAWIFTLPEYRKQGFGSKAVLFWASELQKAGKIPLYSHIDSNSSSRNLAHKLNLMQVFENVSFN